MSYVSARNSGDFAGAKPYRPSLVESLEFFGIMTIPQERIDAHKTRMLAKGSPFARFFCRAILAASLLQPLLSWVRFRNRGRAGESLLFIVGLLQALFMAFLGTVLWLGPAHSMVGILGVIPLLSLIAIVVMEGGKLDRDGQRWTLASITVSGDATIVTTVLPYMPAHLKDRARKAQSVPGARLLVEFFDSDPILYVARGYGPWRELAPIGAWATGDAFLDSF